MKVLVIHTTYKFRGGEDTVVAEEINLLRSRGISVRLLSFDNSRHALLKLLQLPFNVSSYLKTKKVIRHYQPDVVHLHNTHFAASPSVISAAVSCNVPVVITLHNFRLICPSATLFHKGKLFLDSIHSSFPWAAVKHGVYKNSKAITFWTAFAVQLHKWLGTWQKASRYIVLSPHAKTIIEQSSIGLKKDKLVIKPNFCLTPVTNVAEPSAYFLYVGRLSEEKGIAQLIKAFSKTTYQIQIAGDGPMKQQVVDAAANYKNISFLGSVDKEMVADLMQNATALIFPSVWFEGMPLTIIEAFACGLPVIASRLGAMETMITDGYNGFHFDHADEDDLVKKLADWENLSAIQQNKFRQHALDTYRDNYTPQVNAEQLLSIYNSVMPVTQNEVAKPAFP